ncbi:nucleotidyl transferase AbiEii/AbiGii toxin family protein [Oligoflexia bacterium]|nr:nucleotidyl transferase AbiEii/AbiGii toxin family protein [Oligoflexia bacterium]
MNKLPPLLASKLDGKNFESDQEQINAAKEIVQEVALLALSRAGIFQHAAFQGGTAFRICYDLDRFSEDLDFALIRPNKDFDLRQLLEPLKEEFEHWGLSLEAIDKSKINTTVRKAFLKKNSLGALLTLGLPLQKDQKLTVKLEVDTNPPRGARVESKLCHFPTDFQVVCHDPTTMFAGKLHALLARSYQKGRDWYDFVEYLRRAVSPNLTFLHAALEQITPKDLKSIPNKITKEWLIQRLKKRITALNINKLREDVEPFVDNNEKLSLWSRAFFLAKLDTL